MRFLFTSTLIPCPCVPLDSMSKTLYSYVGGLINFYNHVSVRTRTSYSFFSISISMNVLFFMYDLMFKVAIFRVLNGTSSQSNCFLIVSNCSIFFFYKGILQSVVKISSSFVFLTVLKFFTRLSMFTTFSTFSPFPRLPFSLSCFSSPLS